jgi:hypothetical protein
MARISRSIKEVSQSNIGRRLNDALEAKQLYARFKKLHPEVSEAGALRASSR